jgi:tRNA 2-thiouridine synthesizing protein A
MQSKNCYRTAWGAASAAEGIAPARGLQCLLGDAAASAGGAGRETAPASEPAGEAAVPREGADPVASAEWDAGDMGCGDLVLELRHRMASLRPGEVLRLRALDPGAREDIPAWCGMTGHRLARAEHPIYWITRKES